jgi:hypothetical protein
MNIIRIVRSVIKARRVLRELLKEELTDNKIMECLAVDKDTPVLKGVLNVLRGLEELAIEAAIRRDNNEVKRAYDCGAIGAFADAQERIIEIVNLAGEESKKGEARKPAVRGQKSEGSKGVSE